MSSTKKAGLLLTLFSIITLYLGSAHAAMESTASALGNADRTQLTALLEREEVQQQLVEMGVDPVNALARVEQMTDEEVVTLNGQIAQLPAGAGVSTLNLLLIIIIILILV